MIESMTDLPALGLGASGEVAAGKSHADDV